MGLISIDHPKSLREQATDSFGCRFDSLYKNQFLRGGDISFFRKGISDAKLDQVETTASDRGFVIGVSTRAGHQRRIFHEYHSTNHAFAEDAIYIRDLSMSYKADLGGPFDFLLMEISPASLVRIADEADFSNVTSLVVETASQDTVLSNLARALERPEKTSQLFVDQLATAIGIHVVQCYGGRAAPSSSQSRRLSRGHELLAKSLLREHLDGDISILEVARACNLSRGYFTRAFRETTGTTPYRWLLGERIARARDLLRTTNIPLSELAISCGFADQSHFTRVFTSIVGKTPGHWRRNA